MRNDPKICSVVWNLIRGGTEGQCARVAMGMAAMGVGHRVAVFRREGYFLERVEAICGSVALFDIQRFRGAETRAEVRRFAAWLTEEEFDGVHAWDMDANLFASKAARLAGVPYLTSRRDMGEIYPWYKLALQRRAERRAKGVVVNAKAIGAWARADRVPEERIFRIPNIVPVDELDGGKRGEAEALPRCGAMQWVHVARLDPEKDVKTLIRAIVALRKTGADVGLWVVGEGEERVGLEELAGACDVADAIQFFGEMNDVPAVLAQADAGVLVPRANEGLSNTILEYMTMGLPVVATDCGGNRELVEESKCGVVVPVGDVGALAEAMEVVGSWDESTRRETGALGRDRVLAAHQPDQVMTQFRALYVEAFS